MNVARQMVIICMLLEMLGKIDGRTRLQKLFFLLDKKLNLDLKYEKSFYGPFSKRLSDLIELVVRDGVIKEDIGSSVYGKKYSYEITSKGKKFLDESKSTISKEEQEIKKEIENLDSFSKLNLDELIRYIYKSFPTFSKDTTN